MRQLLILLIGLMTGLMQGQAQKTSPSKPEPTQKASPSTPVSTQKASSSSTVPTQKANPPGTKEEAKAYVRESNARISDSLLQLPLDQATKLLARELKGCSNLEDKATCEAGLYYNAGYLFQESAANGGKMSEKYRLAAINCYQQVLQILPDNQQAWNNLVQLEEAGGNYDTTIALMQTLAEKYPGERVNYLIRIGDLYLEQKQPGLAGQYYRNAYDEDPWSEIACGRIVNLYLRYGITCWKNDVAGNSKGRTTNQFAYDCQEIGLPNYAEEVLRQQIIYAIKTPDEVKLEEFIVVWADILAENNWVEARRVEDLRSKFFAGSESGATEMQRANSILLELGKLFEIKSLGEFQDKKFWRSWQSNIRITKEIEVSTTSVLIKILYAKGELAYFAGDFKNTDAFWTAAIEVSPYDNPLGPLIVKDLAQLYNTHPEMDPDGEKLDRLVDQLFSGKMKSYGTSNSKMILEYHTVLAGIFYDRKIWTGTGYSNARFQLEHALTEKYGHITNPELRLMLRDVYEQVNEKDLAASTAAEAIKDMLRLDRVKEADHLVLVTKKYAKANELKNITLTLEDLFQVVKFRREALDPEHDVLSLNPDVEAYIRQVEENEKKLYGRLGEEFVRLQFFKGFSDMAARMPADAKKYQQIFYAEALDHIENISTLTSTGDFKRIKNIKGALEESVDRPQTMSNVQYNKKASFSYKPEAQSTKYKTYTVANQGQEVQIPQSLFELNSEVKDYYEKDGSKEMPVYTYDKSKFVKTNTITPDKGLQKTYNEKPH